MYDLYDARYASLARSKYAFGAGTAKVAPSPERLAEIDAEMAEIAQKIADLKAQGQTPTSEVEEKE